VALGTGLALSQIGEFSFVLAAVAATKSLLPRELEQGLLAVAVLTMAVTPLVIGRTEAAYRLVSKLRLPSRLLSGRSIGPAKVAARSDHLLIIGYGINGRNLARAAREFGLPYAVVEMNPRTVREEIARNQPLYFGDATNDAVLLEAGASRAKAAAVVIGDPIATRGIVAQLRRLNPTLHIIARTRFIAEVQPLYDLGASDVVPEEFETSIEIFHRTAEYFALPHDEVERLEEAIREDQYVLLRRAQEDD
jgi:CPA2 family monovalent cation:H+ antiporter-2